MMPLAPMTVLIAPDKFKGTLTADEVAAAMARGLSEGGDARLCPIADGGDGTAAVLLSALGGEWIGAAAHDPLGEPLEARFALLADGATAVVDVAEASGLRTLAGRPPRPLEATSAGTGELIAAAIDSGSRRVLVACGGSATTEGGAGALARFDPTAAEIVCLCDVSDAFLGALRYAPQKGAGPDELTELEARLERLRTELPHDPGRLPYTGAAGGLAGGLWAHGARLVPGARHVLGAVGFDGLLAEASAVLTGEGRLDATSLSGKAVGEVALRCRAANVPCHAIVGADQLDRKRERFASIREAGDPEAIAAAATEALD